MKKKNDMLCQLSGVDWVYTKPKENDDSNRFFVTNLLWV